SELAHRDLCRPESGHRQRTLVGRADLPAFRQATVEAGCGDRGRVQEMPGHSVPRPGVDPAAGPQSPDHSHAAGPGDRVPLSRQGDADRQMYVLSRGRVDVLKNDGHVGELCEGAIFGELSLLNEACRAATVRAKTACDLWVLDHLDFAKLLRDHPPWAEMLRAN